MSILNKLKYLFYYCIWKMMNLIIILLFLITIIINPFGLPITQVIYSEIQRIDSIIQQEWINYNNILINNSNFSKVNLIKMKLMCIHLKITFFTFLMNLILTSLVLIIQLFIPHRIIYLIRIYKIGYLNQFKIIQEIINFKLSNKLKEIKNENESEYFIDRNIITCDILKNSDFDYFSNSYIHDVYESVRSYFYKGFANHGILCIIKKQFEVLIYDYIKLLKLIIVHLMIFRCIHFWYIIIETKTKNKLKSNKAFLNFNTNEINLDNELFSNNSRSLSLNKNRKSNIKNQRKRIIKISESKSIDISNDKDKNSGIKDIFSLDSLNPHKYLESKILKVEYFINVKYSGILDKFSNQIIYNYEYVLFPLMVVYCLMCILSPLRFKKLISVHENNSFLLKCKALWNCYKIVLTDYLCFLLTLMLLASILSTYDTARLMYYYISKKLYRSSLYYDLNYLNSYKSELGKIFKNFLIKIFLIILFIINIFSVIRTKDMCFRLFKFVKNKKKENNNFDFFLLNKNLSYNNKNEIDIKEYFKKTVAHEWNYIKSNFNKLNSNNKKSNLKNSLTEIKESYKLNDKKSKVLVKLNSDSNDFSVTSESSIKKIALYLNYQDICNFSLGCSAFYIVCSMKKIWKNQYKDINNQISQSKRQIQICNLNPYKNLSKEEKYIYFNLEKDRRIRSAISESSYTLKNKSILLAKLYLINKPNLKKDIDEYSSDEFLNQIIGFKGIIFEESLKLFLSFGHIFLIPLKLISNLLKLFGDLILVFFMFIESIFIYGEVYIYQLDLNTKENFIDFLNVMLKIDSLSKKLFKENCLSKENFVLINNTILKETDKNDNYNTTHDFSSKSLFVFSERKNRNLSSLYDELSSSLFSIFSNTITPRNKNVNISDSLNIKKEREIINEMICEIYSIINNITSRNVICLSNYYRISFIDEAVNKFNFVENIMVKDSFLSDLQIIGIIGIIRFVGLVILFISYSFFVLNIKVISIFMHLETQFIFENNQIKLLWQLCETLKYIVNDKKMINKLYFYKETKQISDNCDNIHDLLQKLNSHENSFISLITKTYNFNQKNSSELTKISHHNHENNIVEKLENNTFKSILNQMIIFSFLLSVYNTIIVSPFIIYFHKDAIKILNSFLYEFAIENAMLNSKFKFKNKMKLMINEYFLEFNYNRIVYLVIASVIIYIMLYQFIVKRLHKLYSLSRKIFIYDLIVSLLYFDYNEYIRHVVYKIIEFILFPQTLLIIMSLSTIKNSLELKLKIYYFIIIVLLAIHPLFFFKILKYTIMNISLLITYFILNLMIVIKKA